MTGATGRTVTFADGDAADVDVVVWATGYTADHSWSGQHTRSSALLGWVGNDAAYLAQQIQSRKT